MEVESSICLSDLVPALRWSRPQQVAEVLGDPRLPAGWWSSLALSRALGTAGLDWICERLARLISSRWDHLPLVDLLPALAVHHVDPALPGWPEATRTAIAGLGGWQRLRRLSPGDLSTPSATPEVVIGSVFREILGRIPAQRDSVPAQQSGSPDVTRPLQRGTSPGSYAPQPESGPQRGSFTPHSDAFPAQPESAPRPAVPNEGGALPQRPAAAAQPGPQQPGSFAPQPGTPQPQPGTPQPSTPQLGTPQAGNSTGAFAAQPQKGTGSFPAQPQNSTGSFPAQP
ncbi:MAG: hypothetical protein HOW71_38335, partial [Nonomuraea sp.]|nr:hypothetical protein [Nonomuraea sp.]